jgi:hypothetical protein
MKRWTTALLTALMVVGLLPTAALAHPEHGDGASGDTSDGVVEAHLQHGEDGGHLPAVNRNVRVVGQVEVSNPSGADSDRGRVADVSAHGDYAYLTAFRSTNCLGGGAWVVDISDPANPVEDEFLPTTPGNYAGEGSQVITAEYGPLAGHQLFLHQNETCSESVAAAAQPAPNLGGINIWDVTDPGARTLLVEHAGDRDGTRANPNTVHSVFAWNSHVDQRVYAVLVDNAERADVDIMDITDPSAPVMVNDSLDLVDRFGVDQPTPATLRSIFNHDMVVKRVGERYVMSVNYWDGGYVLLDVTNPRPGGVTLITESDYAALDEQRLAHGHQISPEGNAHQSELSPDNRFLIGTDEDFAPFRIVATITGGPYAGTEYTATTAANTPAIAEGVSISGTPTWVGEACSPLPAGTGVALVVRGTCSFQQKLDAIRAAGYSSGIVFNAVRSDCLGQVRMAAAGDIPFVFTSRLTGLQLLGVPGVTAANACTTAAPAPGAPAFPTTIKAVFDGWGYVRAFRTQIPGDTGTTGRMQQVGTYAIPESQDPAFASGFGDLSVHEVAIDPNPGTRLAYFSYYAGGIRIAEYGDFGLREVGAFIDEGGSNFWGVEVHRIGRQQYVLASDRDHGLYILQYTGRRGRG